MTANWSFDRDRPIYAQIIEQMKLFIISGTIPPGAKLASVRDLAAEAEVNPNTMQRALAELEREELLRSQRTGGRFVTEDDTLIAQMKAELVRAETRKFLEGMAQLGLNADELIELIKSEGKDKI